MFGNKAQMAGMMKKVKKMQDDMANEAGRKIDDMASQEVNRITGGMGLPPGMF